MRLVIRGTNIGITDSTRAAVIRNMLKLNPVIGSPEISVILSDFPDGQKKAAVTASAPGYVLHAEAKENSLCNAIDRAGESIFRQAKRYREKTAGIQEPLAESTEPYQDTNEITRIYVLDGKPMPADKAVERLKTSGENFMVFKDADTNDVCTVYARKDGSFGLIVPGGEH